MMRKKKKKKFFWKTVVKAGLIIVLILVGLVFLWATTFEFPDLQAFKERKIYQTTKIYDRTGKILLYDLNKETKRTIIPYNKISRHIKNATVAIEDTEFYKHIGVRPLATLRAVLIQPLRGKGVQGGSTITQQVVKNSILTSKKKISRKIKEWVLSLKLEQMFSKDEILAIYLNESPYGGNIYGVEEASQTFFGKSAEEVTLAEASYLAALPKAPTFYSPYGNNLKKLEKRKNLVLFKMFENNFIKKKEYKNALKEKVVFLPRSFDGIRAPHFVFYIEEYLENKYGRKTIEEKGLRVITTLDYSLQEKAQEIVQRNATKNKEKFNAENGSMVAIDPKTGQILVMVGSKDYFDENIDGNFNIAVAHRQPGSAFKPFVYANALNKGYTTETVVFDLKTEFSSECKPDGKPLFPEANCYMPGNYDKKYRGPMTFRNALAQSVNIPAIKVLYLSGLKDSFNLARNMGITSLEDYNKYGLTLVLGGGEVSPLEITSAYSVFANDGIRNPHTAILKIEDSDGNILEKYERKPEKILSKEISRSISDILSDNDARAPAFGQYSYLYFPNRDVAVKTGTTNNYRDAWIIGYTPNIAVGAWAGNNDNSPMEKKVAGFIVAPMWNEFMKLVLEKIPNEKFKTNVKKVDNNTKPVLRGEWRGGKQYFVDKISGKLATEYTPEETREVRVVKSIHSILNWVDPKNPAGEIPKDPQTSPQYERWEYAVRKWAKEKGIIEEDNSVIPMLTDDVHVPQNFPKITISSLKAEYSFNDILYVTPIYTNKYPMKKIDFYINNLYVGSSNKVPFVFSVPINNMKNIKSINTIRVVGQDSVYNRGEYKTTFTVQ